MRYCTVTCLYSFPILIHTDCSNPEHWNPPKQGKSGWRDLNNGINEATLSFFPLHVSVIPDKNVNGRPVERKRFFFLNELNVKNLMFILQLQNSHSASYFKKNFLELLQVSAVVKASQSCSRCSERFKTQFFFFFLKQKHFDVFQHPSLMSSTCKKKIVYLEA